MIVFKKLRFKNFLSYGNAMTEIGLDDRNLTLIYGKNGGGKSTIAVALCWCLFNKTPSNIQKGKLVNSINGKALYVECEFEINGIAYKVCRGIKPSVFEIYQNGELIKQESATKDYQKILEDNILKCSFTSFTQTISISASSTPPFLTLPASQRKQFVENLLNIQIFSIMNEIVKQRIESNLRNWENNAYDIQLLKTKLQGEKALIDTLKAQRERNITNIQEQLTETQKKAESIQESVNKLLQSKEKFDKINSGYGSFRKKHQQLRNEQAKLTSKLETQSKDLKKIVDKDVCPFCHQQIGEVHKEHLTSETQNAINEINTQLNALVETLKEYDEKDSKFQKVNDKLLELNSSLAKENGTLLALNNEIARLNRELQTPVEDVDVKLHEDNIKQLAVKAKDLLETKSTLAEEKNLLGQANLLLRDSGIKTAVIKQYLPIINAQINKHLQDMDFFIKFEFDETFNETIKSRGRDDFSYENLSQGERKRLDMAILFTWRYLSSLLNSCSANILYCDEFLDIALDEVGIESAMNLLRSLNDTSVFIVSHRDDIKDGYFDNIIHVKKKSQFSIIEHG